MRWMRLAVVVVLATCVSLAWGQLGGVRGVIDRQLQGVEEHNRALEEAMGAAGRGPQTPAPRVVPGEIKSGWETRKSREPGGGRDVRLYFAHPVGLTKEKPAAGLLVLQEWWGVNEDIQERARQFAARGFYVVAPDLYNGKVTDDPTEAANLKAAMTDEWALAAMRTGMDMLQEESRNGVIDARRVGALGWCLGGQQSLLLSINDSRVRATAVFYGPLVTDPMRLRALQGPVLGIFGNTDTAPSPTDVAAFRTALTAAGKTDVTIHQFDGAGHAFASRSAMKQGMYHEEKAAEAWNKLWEWLDAKLPR